MAAKKKATRKKATQRQGKRTRELEDALLEHMSIGGTVADFCRENDLRRATVYRWKDEDPEDFGVRFARAREEGCHAWADQCVDIADTAHPENVRVAKLRIHTRMQLMARVNPKAYGQKVLHGGAEDAPPIHMTHEQAAAGAMKLINTAKARRKKAQGG